VSDEPLPPSGVDHFAAVFEGADVGILIIEPKFGDDGRALDYRLLETNPAFARLMQLPDAKGKWATQAQPGVNPKWIEAFGNVARTGAYFKIENHAPTGEWYDIQAFRIGDGKVAILFSDITARKSAESSLAASEARLKLAIDAGSLAVWELDVGSSRLTTSPALNRLYGFADDAEPTLDEYTAR
jgi:PAS domain-containing protein